jgi:hypothetical protein
MSSYIGYSNTQKVELIETDLRIDALEAALPTKVDLTVYTNKVALLESNDATHTADIATLNSVKVDKTTYNAKVSELTTTNANQDTRLTNLEALAATKVAQTAYNTKVDELEAVDAAFGVRTTALEDRATAIETNIATTVQAAIDDKVSDAVFQALATELRDKDSELNGILATKVAQTVQDTTDAVQNAQIALRVLQTDYDAKVSSLDGKNVNWEKRLLAVDQWIRAMLATYTIKKGDNTDFVYTAAYQNDVTITPAPFAVTGKKPGNKLVITLQPFAYNTFYGSIKATTIGGVTIGTLVKAGFNSTTRVAELASSVALDSANFPLTVTLYNSVNEGIQSTQLSLAQYQALVDPSPALPIVLRYDAALTSNNGEKAVELISVDHSLDTTYPQSVENLGWRSNLYPTLLNNVIFKGSYAALEAGGGQRATYPNIVTGQYLKLQNSSALPSGTTIYIIAFNVNTNTWNDVGVFTF